MKLTVENKLFKKQNDMQTGKIFTFIIRNEMYGINIKNVTEIIGLQPIKVVPKLPEYIKGVINLRGKRIPIIDMGVSSKEISKVNNDTAGIIIVKTNIFSVGIIVDSVSEIMNIYSEDIVPISDRFHDGQNSIKGIGTVGNFMIKLLECNSLLNNDDVTTLMKLEPGLAYNKQYLDDNKTCEGFARYKFVERAWG